MLFRSSITIVKPTVRVEGLNNTNNSLLTTDYPRPIAVDANGDFILAAAGYSQEFTQSSINTISYSTKTGNQYAYPSTTWVTINGLSQTVTIPTDGNYMIVFKCFFTADPASFSEASGGQGSFRLKVDGTAYNETFISSTAVYTPSYTLFGLGTEGSIVKVLKLTKGSHTIVCEGRPWFGLNADSITFGINTTAYVGSGGVSAGNCVLTITNL